MKGPTTTGWGGCVEKQLYCRCGKSCLPSPGWSMEMASEGLLLLTVLTSALGLEPRTAATSGLRSTN